MPRVTGIPQTGRRARWRCGRPALLLLALALLSGPAAAFEEGDVSAMVGHKLEASAFPGAGGVWLGRERRITVDGASNVTVDEHLVARIFDPQWGQQHFRPFRRLFDAAAGGLHVARARVWSDRTVFDDLPSGAVSEAIAPQAHGLVAVGYLGELDVQYPELKSGQTVELHLTYNLPLSATGPFMCWVEETFGAEDPVVEQEVVLDAPTASEFQTRILGPDVGYQSYVLSGRLIQSWLTGNLPALPCRLLEGPMGRVPAATDSTGPGVSRLLITNALSWKQLSSQVGYQWEKSWENRNADEDLITHQLSTGGQDLPELALTCQKFVQEQIRTLPVSEAILGVVPPKAGDVAECRAGGPRDKACFLVSLLRSAGLSAYPVWIRTRGGAWDPDLASPRQLDRFVVLARAPGHGDIWLDPVKEEQPLAPTRGLILYGPAQGPPLDGRSGLIAFPGLGPGR